MLETRPNGVAPGYVVFNLMYKAWLTVGLNWTETVKKNCSKNRNMFLVPLNIPELVSHEIFLIRVRLPGGAAIIFAQSLNFELKFIMDNPFMQKINSTSIGSHFLPKKCSREPKTRNQKLYQCLEKD